MKAVALNLLKTVVNIYTTFFYVYIYACTYRICLRVTFVSTNKDKRFCKIIKKGSCLSSGGYMIDSHGKSPVLIPYRFK